MEYEMVYELEYEMGYEMVLLAINYYVQMIPSANLSLDSE